MKIKNYIINIILMLLGVGIFYSFTGHSKILGLLLLSLLILSVISYNLNITYIKEKKYFFGDLYKTIVSIALFIIGVIFYLLTILTPSFSALSYSFVSFTIALIIILNNIFNIIIRLFYRFVFKQEFNLKINRVYTIIELIIFIISLLFFF